MHRFSLFILALALQHRPKIVHAGERVWMLCPKQLLPSFQCSPVHRFILFMLALLFKCFRKIGRGFEAIRIYFSQKRFLWDLGIAFPWTVCEVWNYRTIIIPSPSGRFEIALTRE